MNDYQLERQLRAWFREEIGPTEAAPQDLHAAIHEVVTARSHLFGSRRFVVLLAAAMLVAAMAAAALAIGSGVVKLPWSRDVEPPAPTLPAATASPTPDLRPRAWAGTAPMTVARADHTATLLLDGTLLVAGGRSGPLGAPAGSAERYDPQTDTWTATGNMAVPRQVHAATLLQDGTVLVTGGVDNNGQLLASAELYDPDSGTWNLTDEMTGPRIGHTATLLADGSVLVAGGGDGEEGQRSTEIYDPVSGTWTAAASMNTPRASATATALTDGRILVAGGIITATQSPSAELFDPSTGDWAATGEMVTPRIGQTATLLPEGSVLVVGGDVYRVEANTRGDPLPSAEVFDPSTEEWTEPRPWPMGVTRTWPCCCPAARSWCWVASAQRAGPFWPRPSSSTP